jgi:alkylation response protein AidB-like acyl-CoA dehydrogenase
MAERTTGSDNTASDATESVESFRLRARAWLAGNMPTLDGADPWKGHATSETDEALRAKMLQRKLYDGGFAGICYPREYGGQSLTPAHQKAFNEETSGYEMPQLFNVPTLSIIAPTLLDFGTEEQKQEHLRGIIRGDNLWVQFLSEPSGGSDLAGVLTRATRDGDVFVLNGAKIWSTYAWRSDWALCVCRTDWDVPKHRGITVLIVKVHQPGIQIDQIRHVDGTEEFCQEFFDDVPIPVDNVLGQVNDGWTVATRLLGHERAAVSGSSPYVSGMGSIERRAGGVSLPDLARSMGRAGDERVRQLVAEAHMLTSVHGSLVERITRSITSGRLPGPAGSIARLSGGMLSVRRASIALEVARDRAIAWEEGDPRIGVSYIARQASCLGGGSTEMARNLISERVLGMPRERADDIDRPFRQVRTNTLPSRR